MAWATIQQVTDQTGKTVSAEDLALASSIIDTYAGTDPAMPENAITARDRSILRKATAWQAVWIGSQPGFLDHRGVDYSPSADGTSSQRKSQADQDLAPLAQRELKNLSWVGTKVLDLRGRRAVPKGALMTDFLNESSDWWTGGEVVYPSGGGGGSSSTGLTDWQQITGKPLIFPPDAHEHEIADVVGLQDALDAAGSGGGGGGPVAWAEITGKPATFPPDAHSHTAPAWTAITGKPSAFPPDVHTHAISDVTGLGASLGDLATVASVTALSGTVADLADDLALKANQSALEDLGTATAGDLATLDSRVTDLEEAPGGGGGTLVMRRGVHTSGNLALVSSVPWIEVAGGPQMVIPAAIGDYVEFTIASMLAEITVNVLDLAVKTGSGLVRFLSTGTGTAGLDGAPIFYGDVNYERVGSTFDFVVEAGDLAGGNVTVVLATKGGGGGTVMASADYYPLKWRALNHGVVS